ncbi:MAG: cytochrome c oxidase subunit II [Rhizobiales bacterium]|nr:cytochrome c oxidase subunit II [Hyphomicrobiales bacterium]
METQQSVLSPGGSDAESIATLSWIMFGSATAIFLGVLLVTAFAHFGGETLRRRLASHEFIFYAGIAFPVVTLAALLTYGLMLTGARVMATEAGALRIEITGEQWWWRVRYPTAEVVTANEIRIPAGRQVEIKLSSADVIHSFWVPALAGKVDMIPGVVNLIRLRAGKTGTYRGQCAEYCGGPHALMAFHVIALEAREFDAWLVKQQQPAATASTPAQKQGANLFMSTGCNGCHAIRGTLATGTIGPDLTHVGGRVSIAAATLPNDAQSFGHWIRGNQHIKPNNRMPPFGILSDRELAALGAYLEGLQ